MNKTKTVLTATFAAGALALASVSFALAQGPGPGAGQGNGPGATPTEPGVRHDERHAEVAAILGITEEELDAAIAAGQTPRDIAVEKGIDVAELKPGWVAAGRMNGARAGAMNGTGGGARAGGGAVHAGDCPYNDAD